MRIEEFRAYCRNKVGVEETFPFGDNAVWYRVGGKAFAWTFIQEFTMDGSTHAPFTFFNAKCASEQALLWRERFMAVQPGWHQNKKHWNSVFADGSLPDAQLQEFLDHAYTVAVQALPKKLQQTMSQKQ